jgi:hypothetical protein
MEGGTRLRGNADAPLVATRAVCRNAMTTFLV